MRTKHTIAVLVENKPGVLARVAGLFARRGYNIESLSVGVTESSDLSRMTIVVEGDEKVVEQVIKQLNKQIDVIKVSHMEPHETVNRELALFKIAVEPHERGEVMHLVEIFRGRIVDVGTRTMIIEVTGDEDKISAMHQLLKKYTIKEMVRTGIISMVRGPKILKSEKEE